MCCVHTLTSFRNNFWLFYQCLGFEHHNMTLKTTLCIAKQYNVLDDHACCIVVWLKSVALAALMLVAKSSGCWSTNAPENMLHKSQVVGTANSKFTKILISVDCSQSLIKQLNALPLITKKRSQSKGRQKITAPASTAHVHLHMIFNICY